MVAPQVPLDCARYARRRWRLLRIRAKKETDPARYANYRAGLRFWNRVHYAAMMLHAGEGWTLIRLMTRVDADGERFVKDYPNFTLAMLRKSATVNSKNKGVAGWPHRGQ
jgi:hypothetical protein